MAKLLGKREISNIASTSIDKLVAAVREANNISADLLKFEDSQFDYCDYITRNGLQRYDGCIFNEETFKNSSGIVPVVYDWDFGSLDKIVGLAVLEHRPEGIYAKVTFNETPNHKVVRDTFLDNLNEFGLSFSANCIVRDPEDSNMILSGCIRMVHITPKDCIYTYKEIKDIKENSMSKKEKKEKINKDSRIDVRMTEKDIAWLNILTKATGKSRSDIIRELIAKEAIKILSGEK